MKLNVLAVLALAFMGVSDTALGKEVCSPNLYLGVRTVEGNTAVLLYNGQQKKVLTTEANKQGLAIFRLNRQEILDGKFTPDFLLIEEERVKFPLTGKSDLAVRLKQSQEMGRCDGDTLFNTLFVNR